MPALTRRALLTTTAAGLWCWPRTDRAEYPSAAFVLPARGSESRASEVPLFCSDFIEHHPPLGFAHCPSLCETGDGRIVCVWYAGSREGAKDVAVWMSERSNQDLLSRAAANEKPHAPVSTTFDRDSWSPPRIIVNAEIAVDDLDRYLRKVGNAVIFTDSEKRLWLVYVSIAIGGWSGSSLNACCSLDNGVTWQASRRLSLSPFLNISDLVRAAPVQLESGEIGLPIYHEFLGQFPEMLWLRPTGDHVAVTKTRMTGGQSSLQPAIVPVGPRRALAYLRTSSPAYRIDTQETLDGGLTWSPPQHIDLPNPNSSVAAIGLSTGAVLLAFNDAEDSRTNMTLALSPDGVRDWKRVAVLDDQTDEMFAYPYLIQATDGLIHLAYAWRMKKIRHVAFNEAWVNQQLTEIQRPREDHRS